MTTAMQSAELGELAAALAKVQADLKPVEKTCVNPHLGNRYADLGSVWAEVQRVLPGHGLAVAQPVVPYRGGLAVETRLIHSSGQWMASRFPIEPVPMKGVNLLQATGAAIKYARRYGLESMLGMVTEEDAHGHADDDGNAAGPPMDLRGREEPPRRERAERRTAPPREERAAPANGKRQRTWGETLDAAVSRWAALVPYAEGETEAGRRGRIINGLITEAIAAGKVAEAKIANAEGKRDRAKTADAAGWLFGQERAWVVESIKAHLDRVKAEADEKARAELGPGADG